MDAFRAAQELSVPMNDLGGRFMLSGQTYATGLESGFSGLDFYFSGRAGVLGDVDASTVVSELGFFEPTNVENLWTAGGRVMSRDSASELFMDCGYSWARARLPQDAPAGEFAELVKLVLAQTGAEQPALFRAWNQIPWPDEDIARAMHGIHLLRELRGGHHVSSVLAVGLDPHAAVMVKGGEGNAELFGWPEPHPEPDGFRALWEEAEARTADGVSAVLQTLDPEQLDRLCHLTKALTPKS